MSDDRGEGARRAQITATLADPTIDDALRADLLRERDLYDALAAHLSREAAERHTALVHTLCGEPFCGPVLTECSDRNAGMAFRDKSNDLLAAMNELRPTMLPREVAADVWAALNKANVMIGARLVGRTARGQRSWHAVNVVAVCRGLWVRWHGEEPPRNPGGDDEHPFLDFLLCMLRTLDVRNPKGNAASERGALASWAKVAHTPELDYDFSD